MACVILQVAGQKEHQKLEWKSWDCENQIKVSHLIDEPGQDMKCTKRQQHCDEIVQVEDIKREKRNVRFDASVELQNATKRRCRPANNEAFKHQHPPSYREVIGQNLRVEDVQELSQF